MTSKFVEYIFRSNITEFYSSLCKKLIRHIFDFPFTSIRDVCIEKTTNKLYISHKIFKKYFSNKFSQNLMQTLRFCQTLCLWLISISMTRQDLCTYCKCVHGQYPDEPIWIDVSKRTEIAVLGHSCGRQVTYTWKAVGGSGGMFKCERGRERESVWKIRTEEIIL